MSLPRYHTPPSGSNGTIRADPTSTESILFMSNSEHGQANVVLAAALEVARSPSFHVHFASYGKLESRITALNSDSDKFIAAPIVFHKLRGPSLDDQARRRVSSIGEYLHAPGFINALKSYRLLSQMLLSSKPDEYLENYQSCVEIIERVQPAALVVENALLPARDAAVGLGLEYMVIAPCGPKEIVGSKLPGAPSVLRWPMPSSGYRFPLSFLDRIKNTALVIGFLLILQRDSTIALVTKAREAANIKGPHPFRNMYATEGVRYLLPYLPETDYEDLKEFSLPPNIVPCGPITLPQLQPMQTYDPEMFEFLRQQPTVLVSMGSIWDPDAATLVEMLKALDFVLTSRPDIQILWKLKAKDDPTLFTETLVDQYCSSGRLKIVSWLKTSPSLIVDSGNVACFVHHGGANSYFEACRAGVPQLVLPVWLDTYEFAERARHLGIGLIGNVGCAPKIECEQLGSKLLQTLSDDGMRRRASEVGAACKHRGEGREIAAAEIVRWAEDGRSSNRKGHLVEVHTPVWAKGV